jgi:hypothetical protein
MALSDQWTRAQFRTAIQTELMDPSAKWWTTTELNQYISDWQDQVQERFEFVWGTATVTTSVGTFTLATVDPNMLRLDAVYWDNVRVTPKTTAEMELLQRDWRAGTAATFPQVAYQPSDGTMVLWPPPQATGTVVFEYPTRLVTSDDVTPVALPAWVRYSCLQYACWRAYLRAGPNQDAQKAMRRKQKFLRQIERYVTIRENHFPNYTPSLRPGGKYEGDIVNAGRNTTIFKTWY